MPDTPPPNPTSPNKPAQGLRAGNNGWARRALTKTTDTLRSARRFTSREQIGTFLKNLILVVPITLLIWVYAERENEVSATRVLIPFEIVSGDPSRIVDVIGMDERTVVADLWGSRSRLDTVIDQLVVKDGSAPVRITVDSSLEPGKQHTLRLLPVIDADSIFAQSGVSVSNMNPPTISVFVDKIVTRDLLLQAPPGVTNIESVVFDPPTARVTGPEQMILKAERAGTLIVYADLSRLPSSLVPGPHTEKSVTLLRPVESPDVSITPATVAATFTVREANVDYTFRSMAVFLMAPANIQAQYVVQYEPILNNVTVTGPPQKIEMLQDPNFQPKPRAVLELSREDVTSPRPKTLRFLDLPEGVTVNQDAATREVTYRLVDRAAGQ